MPLEFCRIYWRFCVPERNTPLLIMGISSDHSFKLPLVASPVRAGFPSPADDYIETQLDLLEHLIHHPSATYYIRVKGDSMQGLGINDADLLIVDRSLEPKQGYTVIASVDWELTCKRLEHINGSYYLIAGNDAYPPILLDNKEVHIWGVVIHSIHSHIGKI